MDDESHPTISASIPIDGLAGEPWESLDALKDRVCCFLDDKGIPSDLSTDEALLAAAAARHGTMEWNAFKSLGSINACREFLKLGHYEAAVIYAMQAVAEGMRADPSVADVVAQIREVKAKQVAGGRKGAQIKKDRVDGRNEELRRAAVDVKRRFPTKNKSEIAAYLAPKIGLSATTVGRIIGPALKS